MTEPDSSAPPLTVAICTHNRPALLFDLVAYFAPGLTARGVRLIVVDSASDKPSAAVIDALLASYPEVQLVRLALPGLARARNAALEAVTTPWLAFIDDDERPAPDWIDATLALIARLPADCGACGGNVMPRWPGEPPVLGKRWRNYLSIIDQAGEFDQSGKPRFGAGHSILRVDAVRQVNGFSTELGRVGRSLLSGEDMLLVLALVSAGWKIWHSDRIYVGHYIEPSRLERRWALERGHWEGVSTARSLFLAGDPMLHQLARTLRIKRIGLSMLKPFFGPMAEIDIRLAFLQGVQSELDKQRGPAIGLDSGTVRSGPRTAKLATTLARPLFAGEKLT